MMNGILITLATRGAPRTRSGHVWRGPGYASRSLPEGNLESLFLLTLFPGFLSRTVPRNSAWPLGIPYLRALIRSSASTARAASSPPPPPPPPPPSAPKNDCRLPLECQSGKSRLEAARQRNFWPPTGGPGAQLGTAPTKIEQERTMDTPRVFVFLSSDSFVPNTQTGQPFPNPKAVQNYNYDVIFTRTDKTPPLTPTAVCPRSPASVVPPSPPSPPPPPSPVPAPARTAAPAVVLVALLDLVSALAA